jgi:hypothetical protein
MATTPTSDYFTDYRLSRSSESKRDHNDIHVLIQQLEPLTRLQGQNLERTTRIQAAMQIKNGQHEQDLRSGLIMQ